MGEITSFIWLFVSCFDILRNFDNVEVCIILVFKHLISLHSDKNHQRIPLKLKWMNIKSWFTQNYIEHLETKAKWILRIHLEWVQSDDDIASETNQREAKKIVGIALSFASADTLHLVAYMMQFNIFNFSSPRFIFIHLFLHVSVSFAVLSIIAYFILRREELSLMHNIRMKLVRRRKLYHDCAIILVDELEEGIERELGFAASIFPMSSLQPLWWTTFDKITICWMKRNRGEAKEKKTSPLWHQDYNSRFRIWH